MSKMRVAIRLFVSGARVSEDYAELEDDAELDKLFAELIIKHQIIDKPHMIEVENLDEPDVNERFLRFGTDSALMNEPIAIDLDKL
jgi:hypothetical protein